jgi:hypothetical protein
MRQILADSSSDGGHLRTLSTSVVLFINAAHGLELAEVESENPLNDVPVVLRLEASDCCWRIGISGFSREIPIRMTSLPNPRTYLNSFVQANETSVCLIVSQ